MAKPSLESRGAPGPDARALIARAAAVGARAQETLAAAIDDAFLAPEARLDDRTRAALVALLEALVATVEGELAERTPRLLIARGEPALAEAFAAPAPSLVGRLAAAGLLRDGDFIGECLARVRTELASALLPGDGPDTPDTPSLLVRLAQSSDRVVAAAASAVLIGESHRRTPAEGGRLAGTGLPSELHQRLLWWVAAAMRERAAPLAGDALTTLDRAIAEAALRNIVANDETTRLEAAAMRLAAAIDAQAYELPALLDEALRDRRITVFAALIAHAMGVEYEVARELVIDPAGDRLWLVLRALELPRAGIARIGYQLCAGDPRRDVETFADMLDVVASVDAETARAAVAPLRLHPEYRAALLALDRFGR